jgi:ATP-binding cassette subfamily B protein
VGRNGSGKTTLLHLLLRGYDPEEGTIRFADRAHRDLHPARLRRAVSLVAQEPFLLESFSLRDNLLFGVAEGVGEERVWEVLASLGFAEEVRALPRGLDTLLGDEVGLSGGQSQLLVVARAILQDRPYLLLDEGTNQLDAEHELRIVEALQRLKRHAVVVLVTHRLTTARRADRIHVLDQGRIVESGDHDTLVALDEGLYRRFWEIQVVS